MGFDKFGSGESFDSCDKFGSGGALYVPGVSETVDHPVSMEQATEKIKKAIVEAFLPVIEECARIVKSFMDVVVPYINPLMEEIKRLWDLVLDSYPDKRILWLATHHKKERIRKKNRNRILKWIERNGASGNKTNR